MMTMSAFVEAGGMSMLLQHADNVQISEVTRDLSTDDENYYVDIRFQFHSMKNAPFFGEQDLVKENQETVDTNGFSPPKRIVSILSDDNGPVSTEVEVINNRNGNDHLSPTSERYTNERLADGNKAADKLQMETPQEAVFLPDDMWIRRTQRISAILNKRDSEGGAAEEDTTTNVVSVRGVVQAVASRDHLDSSQEQDEPPIDYEFAAGSPSAQTTTDMAASNEDSDTELHESSPEPHHVSDDREHDLKEILSDPKAIAKLDEEFFKTITEKKVHKDEDKPDDVVTCAASCTENNASSSVREDNAGPEMEVSKGCGLLRTSSLRSATQKIRRSFSRDRRSGKVGGDGIATASAAHSVTNADNSTSYSEVKREEDQPGNDEDEIQPNPNPQRVKKAHPLQDNPDPNISGGENEQGQTAVNRVKQTASGLLRKSSILAKDLFRKIGSTDAKMAKRQSAGLEENAAKNDDQDKARGLRSLLRKLSSGAEATGQNGTTAPEGSADAKAAKRQSPELDEKAAENDGQNGSRGILSLLRKFSSGAETTGQQRTTAPEGSKGAKAAKRQSPELDETAATNDGQNGAKGIRSLLRKFSSAAEMTTQQETKAPEDEARAEGEPSKFGKRRSLIFGRRYKE